MKTCKALPALYLDKSLSIKSREYKIFKFKE